MKHVLTQIRDLIQDPAHWTQHAHARNKDGQQVYPTESNACRWCLDGALGKAAKVQINEEGDWRTNPDYEQANALLMQSAQKLFGKFSYVEVNDEEGHQAVMQLLDKAMELVP
jgi:hypothetical protein